MLGERRGEERIVEREERRVVSSVVVSSTPEDQWIEVSKTENDVEKNLGDAEKASSSSSEIAPRLAGIAISHVDRDRA